MAKSCAMGSRLPSEVVAVAPVSVGRMKLVHQAQVVIACSAERWEKVRRSSVEQVCHVESWEAVPL